MLTVGKTKFSCFCWSGAQAEGPGLLLWGQVKGVQIARTSDNHLSQMHQRFNTACIFVKLYLGRLKALDKTFSCHFSQLCMYFNCDVG